MEPQNRDSAFLSYSFSRRGARGARQFVATMDYNFSVLTFERDAIAPLFSRGFRRWLGVASVLLAGGLRAAASVDASFEWTPDSVFREFTFNKDAKDDGLKPKPFFAELDPGTLRRGVQPNGIDFAPRIAAARSPRAITIAKSGAQRAEIAVEYWGGHSGTTAWFTVNQRSWIPLPRPVGTPGPAEHYYHTVLGNRMAPIDLAELAEGENILRFAAGPQIIGNFDWGMFWVYSFTLRLYYQRTPEHPHAAIANWTSGAALPENPEFIIDVQPGAAPIARVDVFAFYDDFNYSGSGHLREWHAQSRYGLPHYHVGSATTAPFRIRWDTAWVPDQSKPIRLIARVVDANGWHSVTPVIDNLSLARRGRSVQLAPAMDVPKLFAVRAGREMSCGFDVPTIGKLQRARLAIMTWSGNHAERIEFNGRSIAKNFGRWHDYHVDFLDVPAELVRPGRNTFSLQSDTKEHAAEVMWPGPALLLEYAEP